MLKDRLLATPRRRAAGALVSQGVINVDPIMPCMPFSFALRLLPFACHQCALASITLQLQDCRRLSSQNSETDVCPPFHAVQASMYNLPPLLHGADTAAIQVHSNQSRPLTR